MNDKIKNAAKLLTCRRCKGSGYLAGFAHIDNGRCWGCMGKGKVPNKAQRLIDAAIEAEEEVERRREALEQTRRINAESMASLIERAEAKGLSQEQIERRKASRKKRHDAYEEREAAALSLWEGKLTEAKNAIA